MNQNQTLVRPAHRPAHRYVTIGTTYDKPRDCTRCGYLVEYSSRTRRTRVTFMTNWQGSRCKVWFFDDQDQTDATELLDYLTENGLDAVGRLGEPSRVEPVIR